MKLASYVHNGNPGYGIVTASGIVDLHSKYGHCYPTLRAFIEADVSLDESMLGQGPGIPAEQVQFLPVIPDCGAIFCVGLNYADHARETGRTLPAHPATFLKLARTLVGHGKALLRPKVSQQFDWEAELAVVIGRCARHVSEREALAYVAGYTCMNDGSIRDWQLERDLAQGKNFLSSGACGPWMVTRDEVPDPGKLLVMSRLNGVEMQRSSTSQLIFSVQRLVAYYSALTELRPGDLISTGTPAGVGHRREPKLFMRPGDVIEVEVSGVGVLRNTVADE